MNYWESKCDPGDHRRIFVYGSGATKLENQLKKAIEPHGDYKIFTREMEDRGGLPVSIFTPLTGPEVGNKKFHPRFPFVLKTWQKVSPERWICSKVSTCEMIVSGEDRNRVGDCVDMREFWAVVTAHHFLTPEQCHNLRIASLEERNRIWNEICSPTNNVQYTLEDHEGRQIDTVGQPLFQYWHFRRLRECSAVIQSFSMTCSYSSSTWLS